MKVRSYGVKEAYKTFRKMPDRKYKCLEDEFYRIISNVQDEVINTLFETKEIDLPLNLGTLTIRKRIYDPEFKDGKLVGLPPINWKATNELWEKDPISKEKKTIIRYDIKEVFFVHFSKRKSRVKYKYNMTFNVARTLKYKLTDLVTTVEYDTYLI